jgi:ubiquinone biosynthesis protein
MLSQILVHGFFHADPHPGNLVVLPGDVVGFLDLGIVGRLDEQLQDQLAGIIRAVGQRDVARLATLAAAIASPTHDVDEGALERDLGELIETYADVPLAHLSMSALLSDVVQTAARHRLRIPSNLMLLIKAVVTIESVGRAIDPSFKMVEHAAPLAERLWIEHYSPAAMSARLARAGRRAASALGDVPVALDAVLRKARAGRLEVQFVHRNLEHFVREMDRSSNRLSFAIVIGSLVVASALVIQTGVGTTLFGYPLIGLAGFLVAGVLGIGLAIGVIRSGRL